MTNFQHLTNRRKSNAPRNDNYIGGLTIFYFLYQFLKPLITQLQFILLTTQLVLKMIPLFSHCIAFSEKYLRTNTDC